MLEVVCEQHGVPNCEAVVREIGLRLVRLEATERSKLWFALCDVQNGLSTILTNVVSQQTASERRVEASAGPDGRERVSGDVLEGGEGLVLLQTLGKVLSGLGVEVGGSQTANESGIHASAGLDGRGRVNTRTRA